MTGWLKQSTSVSVVIGPVWATANGSLKADLAYNASGINCDVYKNGTKADVTLANSAGDGYFRAASGEALYLLTLSTGHTDTLGMFTISLSATGYYMKPQHYMVVPANVWDSMFGSDMLKVDVHSIDDDETAADNLESACDNYSATRGLAGTALPAAAADAAGGLPISDAGGLDLDAKLANTNEVTAARMGALTDLIDGGRLDLLIDAIKAKTDNLPTDPADASDIDAQLATIAGYLDTEIAAILAAVDTEVAAIKAKTDNLPASPAATGAQMDLVNAPNATALAAVAVAILDTLLSAGDADALNARTVRSALRALRNKTSIAAGTMTVCKENDSDAAWTAAATTDPAAEPITEIDPA